MPSTRKKQIKIYLFVVIVIIIILLLFLIFYVWQKPDPEMEELMGSNNTAEIDVLEEIGICYSKINDVKVIHKFQRELNTLSCFKNLAEQGVDQLICLNFTVDNQAYCLAPFARVRNNLAICELGENSDIVENCIVRAIKDSKDCEKLTQQKYFEFCFANEISSIDY